MKRTFRILSVCFAITLFASSFAIAETTTSLHDNIRSLLEMALEDQYYYKLEGNESGYIIRIADEGVAVSAMMTALGLQSRDLWQSYIDSTIAWANSISDFIEVCGAERPTLLFLVVDEFEMKETILAIYNGTVIFDYAPAK